MEIVFVFLFKMKMVHKVYIYTCMCLFVNFENIEEFARAYRTQELFGLIILYASTISLMVNKNSMCKNKFSPERLCAK